MEPVFFHAMPQTLYEELLSMTPLRAVLDLTPGDGALALSAYRSGLLYVGLVFSEIHKELLMQHIERTIWQSMFDDMDMLYEPQLVAALFGEGTAKANARPEPDAKAKAVDKKRKHADREDPDRH